MSSLSFKSIWNIFSKSSLGNISAILYDFSLIVFPQIFFFSCLSLQGSVNLFFISIQYKDGAMLNAIGISNLYINITTGIILSGILGALDTLAANAYGAKNFKMVGIYFDRCRYIGITYFIIISLFHFFFARSLLSMLKVETHVIDLVLEYISAFVFCQWFNINFQINTRHFVLLEKAYYNLITAVISMCLHTSLCYFFVCVCDFGIRGASLACLLVSIFNMTSALVLIHRLDLPEGSWIYFSKEGWRDWNSYMKIAWPGIVISGSEWLGFEIQGITAIYMSSQSYSTMIIWINLECLCYPLIFGISNAAGMKTGEKLIKDSNNIRYFINVCFGFSWVISGWMVLMIHIWGDVYFKLLSPEDSVYLNCLHVKGLVEYYVMIENCYYFYLGILKGFGYLKNPTYLTCFIFYVVELSLTVIMGFAMEMGVYGIWWSMSIGCTICDVVFIWWVIKFDIEELKSVAIIRMNEDEKNVIRVEMEVISGDWRRDLIRDEVSRAL